MGLTLNTSPSTLPVHTPYHISSKKSLFAYLVPQLDHLPQRGAAPEWRVHVHTDAVGRDGAHRRCIPRWPKLDLQHQTCKGTSTLN